jgi:hypothetical protein
MLARGNEMELEFPFHIVPVSKQPQNLYDIYLMLMYSLRLLMMDGKTIQNM